MAILIANGRNEYCQLTDINCDEEELGFPYIKRPKYINNIPKKVSCIATGQGHSIIVDKSGKVFGVGDNTNFQLGSFGELIFKNPVEMKFNNNSKIEWASCGYDYTIFLDEDGQLIYDGKGKVGKIIPLQNKIVFVTAGSKAPVAIDTQGDMFIFDKNFDSAPKMVRLPDPVYDVAVSCFFIIAVTIKGDCYGCMDLNSESAQDPHCFSLIKSLKGIKIKHVYAFNKNACAVASDGRVFMRGSGSYGELGNGSFEDSNDFVQCSIREKVVAASLGQSFALFLTSNGSVYSCGKNSKGSLMLDSNEARVAIPEKSTCLSETASYVCAGCYHSFVLANNTIVHPGASYFSIEPHKKKDPEPLISGLFQFLGFNPDEN